MRQIFIIAVTLLFTPLCIWAKEDVIKNIRVSQEGKSIVIMYDLERTSIIDLSVVTYKELGDYITREVKIVSSEEAKVQTPCVIPSSDLDSNWQNRKLK